MNACKIVVDTFDEVIEEIGKISGVYLATNGLPPYVVQSFTEIGARSTLSSMVEYVKKAIDALAEVEPVCEVRLRLDLL
jgi:hypothetical protein